MRRPVSPNTGLAIAGATGGTSEHPAVLAALVPARHLRRALDHAPPAPGVDRMRLQRVAVVRQLVHTQLGQGDDAIRTEDLELHGARILAARVGDLVDE